MLHLALFHEYNMVLSIFLLVFQTMSFLWLQYNIILYLRFHNFLLFYIFGHVISFVLFVISFLLYPLVILVFFHKLGKTVLLLHFLVLLFGMQIVLVLLIYPILYLLLILLQIHIMFC